MTRLTPIIVVMFGLMGLDASATVFVDNFDLYGDYTQYLHSTVNAEVYTESWPTGPTHYWAPSTSDWGEVVYKYDLPFSIVSATVHANVLALTWWDSDAEAYLDVSPDGTDWTQVYIGNTGWSIEPIDVTSYLAGSDTAYVRARLRSRNSPIGAQFIRTAAGMQHDPLLQAPNVYEFRAVLVPEPSTLAMLSILGALGIIVGWWRRRRRVA